MNWPWGAAQHASPAAPWGNFGQPPPQVVFNQFGQPVPQTAWPFNNDNNPAPWRNGSKWPQLHPILAADVTQLNYHVAQKANVGVNSSAYMANASTPATRNPTAHMRLISPQFPWSIDIKPANPHTPITVGMVWDAIHAVFQDDIRDSEWGLVVHDKKLRMAIERAAKKRMDGDKNASKKLRRIDWLGEQQCLKGLEHDENFAKARLLPGEKECPDTWVVKLYAP